jgi:hypothetical protein
MTASVYHQITDQDENNNSIKRKWVILKNISCSVVPIRESGGSATSDNKIFTKEYKEELEIKMHSGEKLSKRWRVSDIRNNNMEELYKEIDRVSMPSTIFEVFASHPIFDIFGNIQYYENHLKRVMVQSND